MYCILIYVYNGSAISVEHLVYTTVHKPYGGVLSLRERSEILHLLSISLNIVLLSMYTINCLHNALTQIKPETGCKDFGKSGFITFEETYITAIIYNDNDELQR